MMDATKNPEGPSPEQRVRTLIDLTERLSAIIAQENDLLATRRPRDLAPLQIEKARLASAYAEAIRTVAGDRQSVAGASAPLIEKLRELTKTFEGCAMRQQSLLGAAKQAGEGLVRAVAQEVARTAEPVYASSAARTSAIVVDERA